MALPCALAVITWEIMTALVSQIAAALADIRRAPRSEKELHEWMEERFTRELIPFRCEVETGAGPVDFAIGTVLVEVKVQGSGMEVSRQVIRYLQSMEFDGAVIVTTKAMQIPIGRVACECGALKPVHVISLWRQFL